MEAGRAAPIPTWPPVPGMGTPTSALVASRVPPAPGSNSTIRLAEKMLFLRGMVVPVRSSDLQSFHWMLMATNSPLASRHCDSAWGQTF